VNGNLQLTFKGVRKTNGLPIEQETELVQVPISEDAEMRHEDDSSHISKFYLGQKIDEVLTGDLKRPPANFSF
jgi:hypothetical protein